MNSAEIVEFGSIGAEASTAGKVAFLMPSPGETVRDTIADPRVFTIAEQAELSDAALSESDIVLNYSSGGQVILTNAAPLLDQDLNRETADILAALLDQDKPAPIETTAGEQQAPLGGGGSVYDDDAGSLIGLMEIPTDVLNDILEFSSIAPEFQGASDPFIIEKLPSVANAQVGGEEDTPFPLILDIDLSGNDGPATIVSMLIGDIPEGVILSDGTNSFTVGPGNQTADVSDWDLAALTLTTPADSDAGFTLAVITDFQTADGNPFNSIASIDVAVAAAADAPTLTADPAADDEDSAIALTLGADLTDIDGSEAIASITIEDIPEGAVLSDGSYSFTATAGGTSTDVKDWNLALLTVTPPSHSDADFTLKVTATSEEASNGDRASTSADIAVTLTAVVDAPELTVAPASGDEDTSIALTLNAGLADADGSEAFAALLIGAIPTGAVLSDGTNTFTAGTSGTSVDVKDWDLSSLTVTPHEHSDVDFTLKVTATSEEASNGDQATNSADIAVTVGAVVDTPGLTLSTAAPTSGTSWQGYWANQVRTGTTGNDHLNGLLGKDTLYGMLGNDNLLGSRHNDIIYGNHSNATTAGNQNLSYALNIAGTFPDADGSEIRGYEVRDVPTGVTLSKGTDLGGGVWKLTTGQTGNLKVNFKAKVGEFTLKVAAIAEEKATGDLLETEKSVEILFSDDDRILGGSHNDRLYGQDGNDRLEGEAGKDTLYGGDGDDVLLGGTQNDLLYGQNGNDRMWGQNNNDRMWGGDGDDEMRGGNHNDQIKGQNGDDRLWGEHGNDTLWGEDGNDTLQGGIGNDRLYGGAGQDTHIWADNETGTDRVYEFTLGAGGDILDISDLLDGGPAAISSGLDAYLDFAQSGAHTQVRVNVDGAGTGTDQTITLANIDLTAGNSLTDQDIINDLLTNGQLIVG